MYFLKRCWAEINLDNVVHNYRFYKALAKNAEVIAVVKANAYGHGANEIAHVLTREGCNYYAVSNIIEAVNLRKSGIKGNIMILGYTPCAREEVDLLCRYDIIQTVHDALYAEQLSATATHPVKCYLKFDTGMGRIGFLANDQKSIDQAIAVTKLPHLHFVGAFTHLAVADMTDVQSVDFTHKQIQLFENTVEYVKNKGVDLPIIHCCNSAGGFAYPDKAYGAIRLGISLYGLYPPNERVPNMDIRPVMTLRTTIGAVKQIDKGISVSYGRTFVAKNTTKVATVTIGYADGYSRLLSNKGYMIVNGRRASVIGRVTMDQVMLDVTDIDCHIGDEVTVFGGEGASAEQIATAIGTINYAVTCSISARVPRVFFENGSITAVRDHTY